MPSNDVLQIKIEINGTIWVNCYKQPPSYFDNINNRFVSFEDNKTVVNTSNSLLYPSINPEGGIFFSNINGSLFFKNKKIHTISKIRYNNLYVDNIYVGTVNVGIEEVLSENSFSAYPNPASDFISIIDENEILKIEIIDIYGKLIKSEKVYRKQTNVDVNELLEGLYFLKIYDNLGSKTEKFIKN